MMELAGARTDLQRLLAWCDEQEGACDPPEMPDQMEKFNAMRQQPDVQQALQRSADSYRDPRIQAVFAIAPAVALAFTPQSLQEITIPWRLSQAPPMQ